MRTQVDALLSVRRWVRCVLPGPPWRLLLAGDQGRVERPYAIVSSAEGATVTQEGPQLMSNALPVVVQCYPPSGSRPSGSKLIAERVASALDLAIAAGVPDFRYPEDVRGATRLIPLWDYGGVDPDDYESEDVLDDSQPTRLRPDYMRVSDGWKASTQPQADTGELFVATLEMRVQWFSPAGLRSVGQPFNSVRVRITE